MWEMCERAKDRHAGEEEWREDMTVCLKILDESLCEGHQGRNCKGPILIQNEKKN